MVGKTPNGIKFEGKLQGSELFLKFSYQGPWNQLDELWSNPDFQITGAIRASVFLQGRRLEGKCVEASPSFGTRTGILTANFEEQGLLL